MTIRSQWPMGNESGRCYGGGIYTPTYTLGDNMGDKPVKLFDKAPEPDKHAHMEDREYGDAYADSDTPSWGEVFDWIFTRDVTDIKEKWGWLRQFDDGSVALYVGKDVVLVYDALSDMFNIPSIMHGWVLEKLLEAAKKHGVTITDTTNEEIERLISKRDLAEIFRGKRTAAPERPHVDGPGGTWVGEPDSEEGSVGDAGAVPGDDAG